MCGLDTVKLLACICALIWLSSVSGLAADSTNTKSPTGAVVRSLVLPGWGQWYNEDYWKVPISLGSAAFFTYRIVDFNSQCNDADAVLAQLDDSDPNRQLFERRAEFYRDKRDEAALFLGVVYVISALDAYVGAHLSGFDVDDTLSVRLLPNPAIGGISITASW